MDLLLWRHAQAVDATADLDDLQRPLTKQGEAHATQWPHSPTPVMVVGHQPTLGLLAQRLLGMQTPCPIKKGAMWWLRRRVRDGEAQVVLVTVQNPQML